MNEVPDPTPPAAPSGDSSVPPSGGSTETSPPAASEWERQFKYLLADFENFRKRTARERSTIRLEAEAELLRLLIPLYETFERAREATESLPTDDSVRRGLELLDRDWSRLLDRLAFAKVADVGQAFREDEHEAVGEVPSSPDHPAGSIAEVVQQGYRFRGGLLRPAKVLVARALASTASPSSPERDSAPSPKSEPSESSSA
jgi:molecular chaperone GrpE